MSDAGKGGVGVRVYTTGGALVKREIREIGDTGKRSLGELAVGARTVNPALRLMSSGVSELKAGVSDLAMQAGAGGRALMALGAGGVTAAAAIAGALLALNQAREGMRFADELDDQAAKLLVTTDTLQEYRYAVVAAGGSLKDADGAIEGFSKKLGQAQAGQERALKWFKALGFTKEQLQSYSDAEDLLPLVADRLAGITRESQQVAATDGLGLGPMLPLIRKGSEEMARLRQEAHTLGWVMDAELVKNGAAANQKFEAMQHIIGVQLKSAFIGLAPAILDTMKLVAQLAQGLADAADKFRVLDEKSNRGVRRQIGDWSSRRDALMLQYGSREAMAGRRVEAGVSGLRNDGVRGPLHMLDAGKLYDALNAGIARGLSEQTSRRQSERPSANVRLDAALDISRGGSSSPSREDRSPIRTRGAERIDFVTAEEMAARRELVELQLQLEAARDRDDKEAIRALEEKLELNEQIARLQKELFLTPEEARLSAGRALALKPEGLIDWKDSAAGKSFLDVAGIRESWNEARLEMRDDVGEAFADGAMAAFDKDFTGWLSGVLRQAAYNGFANAGRMGFDLLTRGGRGDGGSGAASWVAKGASFLFGGGRAGGGGIEDGYMYRTAEQGTELAMIGRSGKVFSHQDTAKMLQDLVGGAHGVRGQRGGDTYIDARGAGPREIDQLRQMFQNSEARFGQRVMDMVTDAQDRTAGRAFQTF